MKLNVLIPSECFSGFVDSTGIFGTQSIFVIGFLSFAIFLVLLSNFLQLWRLFKFRDNDGISLLYAFLLHTALFFAFINIICLNGFSLFSLTQVSFFVSLPKLLLILYSAILWVSYLPIILYIFTIKKPRQNVFQIQKSDSSQNLKLLLYSYFVEIVSLGFILLLISSDSSLFTFGEVIGIISFSFAFLSMIPEIFLPYFKKKQKEWEAKQLQLGLVTLNNITLNDPTDTDTLSAFFNDTEKPSYFASFTLYKSPSLPSFALHAFSTCLIALIMSISFHQHWSSYIVYFVISFSYFVMFIITIKCNYFRNSSRNRLIPNYVFSNRSDDSAFTDSFETKPKQAI